MQCNMEKIINGRESQNHQQKNKQPKRVKINLFHKLIITLSTFPIIILPALFQKTKLTAIKKKGNLFCPSVSLLDQIAARYQKAVFVDAKTEWLFICGRDIFSVQETKGNPQENDLVLVLNRFKECIGVAQYTANPNKNNPWIHKFIVSDS